ISSRGKVDAPGGAGDAAVARHGQEAGQCHECLRFQFENAAFSNIHCWRKVGVIRMSLQRRTGMPITTPLTSLLGITHPILSAPMDVIAGARLAAAVSEAGGFGILGGGYGDKFWLEQETAKLKTCRAPFGIGFITWSMAKQPELLDIALRAKP